MEGSEESLKKVHFIPDESISTLSLIEKDEEDKFELELKDKIKITHDTFKLIFKLPTEEHVLGLHTSGHICIHNTDQEGKAITRKYTPVSQVNQKGEVSFVIKVYKPTDEFPNGGKMS